MKPSKKTKTTKTTVFIRLLLLCAVTCGTNAANTTPTCPKSTELQTISEDTAVGADVIILNCTDADAGTDGNLTYTINSGNDDSVFQITTDYTTKQGYIQLASTWDYDDVTQAYTLVIGVNDQGTPALGVTVTVNLFVTGINDNDPFFIGSPFYVDISENQALYEEFVVVSSFDLDLINSADYQSTKTEITSTSGPSCVGKFFVDQGTGEMKLIGSLDYETASTCNLTLNVSDVGLTPVRSSVGEVYITIENVNDNKPTCQQSLYGVAILESAVVNDVIADLNCSDVESGTQVSCFIVDGNAADKFDVVNCVVKLKNTIDVDTESSNYQLTITVRDQDVGAVTLKMTSTVWVSVEVGGLDDNQPVWASPDNGTYTVSVNENSAVGTLVGSISATDADKVTSDHAQITYSIDSSTDMFDIEYDTGKIIVKNSSLDRETSETHVLIISAYSSNNTGVKITGTFTVNVADLNDNTPQFDQALQFVTAAEDTAVNSVLATANATDSDQNSNGQITLSITSGNTAAGCTGLNIDNTTGAITNTASLDYDSATSCELVVQASDGGSPSLSSTARVIITVIPVNEFTPTFAANISATILENVGVGTSVASVVAADADAGVDGQVVYTLTNHNDTFTIDTSSGEVKTSAELDRETTDTYELVILATDQSLTTVLTGTVTVTVNIGDANDQTPAFTQSLYMVTTAEDVALNTVLVTVNATDSDENANGQVTHSITSGNTAAGCTGLNIDNTTGAITNTASLDYDSATSCELVVQASDGGSPSLSSTARVIITVTPVNEFTPTFAANISVTILENVGVGTSVATVAATDADAGVDGQVVYSLTNHNGTFTIDTSSGEIKTSAELDRETTNTYELVILATDQSLTTVLTGTVTITVNIGDANDQTPTFTQSLYTVTTAEDVALNTVLVTVNATDSDENANGQVTHSITSGNTAAGCTGLNIDNTTGAITNTASLDYDSATSCELVVQASDGGSPSLSSTARVIIVVTPVNEFTPTFAANITVTILENIGIDKSVTTVAATDADGGVDGQVVYSLTNHNDTFTIDTSSGEVRTSAELDRETTDTYELVILATDQSLTTVLTGTVTVTIIIDDVNDNAPSFSQPLYAVTTAENTTLNTVLVTVNATDPDKNASGQISYTIASGNTGAGCIGLSVHSTDGDITNTQNLDYDSATKCTLSVIATDGGSLSSTTIVLIAVTSVNEFTPAFAGNVTVTIAEDTNPGSSVANVVASDSDSGLDGDITYYLDIYTSVFAIDSANGDIYLISDLDRETTSEYQVDVRAVDGAVPDDAKKTGYATVTFTIDDVNDNQPSCVDIVIKKNITAASLSVGDIVHSLNCSDSDDGANGNIIYNLVGCAQFSVAADGNFKIATLPLIQLNYICQVNVIDQGIPALSIITYINVEVHSEPTLTNLPVDITIPEDEAISALIYSVNATVISESKTFEIVSGNAENKFKINSLSGNVYIYETLDRETTSNYDIGIKVTDQVSTLTAVANINITVSDANDNTPQTPQSFYVLSISENAANGTTIQSLAATDPDEGVNAVLSYNIADGNGEGKFSINTVGELLLDHALDAEATKEYKLTVIVSDSGSPSLTGTTTVFINVTNINEHPVEFLSTGYSYNKTLPEDTSLSSKVFKVEARDLDVNAQGITYSIAGGNTGSTFSMVSSTGEIYLDKFLDRETTASYVLVVTADNGAGDTANTTVDITVTDVNDNDPKFSSNVYTATVDETEALGALVKQVTCSDMDEGINANFTLSIVGGNTGNAFRLDGDKLEVNTALDFATVSGYLIIIKAEDQGSPTRSSSATVDVDINPIYKTPKFAADTQSLSVPENEVKGNVILDADATQYNATEGVDLKYTIQAGNGDGKFSIDPTTGVIKLVGDLNRESIATYNLFIKAENTKNNLLDDTLALTITVTDINDNDPVFNPSTYVFFVDEKVANGSSVGSVTASDADLGTNAALSFSLISGENMNDFTIDSSTGEVKVNSFLDASVRNSYYLTVQALDGGAPSRSSTTILVITVNDLNDNTPSFDLATYNIQISESVAIGQTVAVFKATDLDPGANGQVTYRISSGNGNFKFSLDSFNGTLEMFNTLDRETLSSYVLVIEAVDGGTPSPTNTKTGTATVSINIKDYNDNAPTPNPSFYPVTVPRSTAVSSSLVNISATDPDEGSNSEINYFLVSGNTDNLFLVDSSSGSISTISSLMTGDDNYTIIVRVMDNGIPALSATATVSITLDPPLNPGVSNYKYTVAENHALNSVFGIVAINPVHAAGATVDFTIHGGNGDSIFAIGLTSGDLTLIKNLDYETRTDHYLTIFLQDRAVPSINYYKQVHVEVTDVNDNSPSFVKASYTSQIVENSPVGFPVTIVSATDLDSTVNGQLTYFLSPTANPSALQYLQIDGNTGEVTLKLSPDFETINSIVTEVLVKDAGATSLTGTAQFTVNIIDILDDNTGGGAACFISTEVPTNFANNEVILALTPSKFGLTKGISDTVSYSTVGQGGVFGVTSTSGDLYVLNKNMLYANAKYVLTVTCEVKTPNNSVTAASCLVRVDTLTPSQIVVLKHSVSKAVLDPQLNALIAALQTQFPSTRRVGICKVTDLTATSRRRKLLATESESQMYVVSDTSTDTLGSLSSYKSFSSQTDILSVVQQSSDGTPTSALTSSSFTSFPITSVTAYTYTSSSSQTWPETTVGIAVLSTIGCSVVLLAAILTTYFCCTRERKYRLNQEDKHKQASTGRLFDNPDPPMYQIEDKSPLVAPYRSNLGFVDTKHGAKAAYSVETASKMNGIPNSPKTKKISKSTKVSDSEERETHSQDTYQSNTATPPSQLDDSVIPSLKKRNNKGCRHKSSVKDHMDILLEKAGFGFQSFKKSKLTKWPRPVFCNCKEITRPSMNKRKHSIQNHSVHVKSRKHEQVWLPVKNQIAVNNKDSVHPTMNPATNRRVNVTSPYKDCLARDPFYVNWANIVGHRKISLHRPQKESTVVEF